MNKLILLMIALTSGVLTNAQDFKQMNRWSIGLNVGGQDAVKPVETSTNFFTYANGDLRYMVNNRFGIMGDIGYNQFSWKEDTINATHLTRISLQGVINLGDILRLNTPNNRFGLLLHGGAGLSNMWQEGLFSFADGDLMGNFIAGLSPQIRLSDRVALNADWSGVLNVRQDRYFDFKRKNNLGSGINGFYMTASVGVKFYLGKNDRHADWTPTEFGAGNGELEQRVAELEELLKDDDGDGVPNAKDKQPNTPPNTLVNSSGEIVEVPVDTDHDGIIDEFDQCPTEKGLFSTNGCPDRDQDGVIDSKDKCPDEFGSPINEGCIADEATQKVFDEALHGINFETGKDEIKTASYAVLDRVVEVLNTYPAYSIEIHGHSDSSGDNQENFDLSKDRAKAVSQYLLKKGVSQNRLKTFGHGDTEPISTNSTDEGRAENRRVEFKLKY